MNNFDLLRLVAAAQVAFFHTTSHLGVDVDERHPLVLLAASFSGVPIFFVISGYLISASWEHSPHLASYARNRALRIYPALWACLAVAVASAAWIGHVDFWRAESIPWLLAQLSFVQFYNPDFLRGYGVGALNGSLWTIPVELQFYILVPLLYVVLRLRERAGTLALLAIGCVSLAAQSLLLAQLDSDPENLIVKLFKMSIAPYLWMFLLGVLLQRNFALVSRWLVGKGALWLAIYSVLAFASDRLGLLAGSNHPHPVPMVVLALTTISCAHTAPWLATRLLRGVDASYGVYIHHMVVVNAAIALGSSGSWMGVWMSWACTAALAIASWFLIERPALRRKKNPLHALTPRA